MTLVIIFRTIQVTPLTAFASSYNVKTDMKSVSILVGHRTFNHFLFYKDGKYIGKSLKAKYTISNKSVLKLKEINNEYGACFEGKKVGTSKVTCTYKGHSATITVKVKKMDAHINHFKTVYIPVGTSEELRIDALSSVGTVTLKNSNSSVIKLEKTKAKLCRYEEMTWYNPIEVKAKKLGKSTITLSGKGATDKIRIVVVPKIKVKIYNYSYKKKGDKYNYIYTITNHGPQKIVVGSDIYIGSDHGGTYCAKMNQGIKTLKKGMSATYTFSTPIDSPERHIFADVIDTIYIKCNGYCYAARVDDYGNLVDFSYRGKLSFDKAGNYCPF